MGSISAAPNPRLRETIRRLERGGDPGQSLRRSRPGRRSTPPRISACPPSSCTPGGTPHTWRAGDAALDELRRAARHAADMGLFVHAGHGLTYLNVVPVARIPEIEELNIGHSVVSRAVMTGMHAARWRRCATWSRVQGPDSLSPMTNPLATADFFAFEAGECLDRLEATGGPGGAAARG